MTHLDLKQEPPSSPPDKNIDSNKLISSTHLPDSVPSTPVICKRLFIYSYFYSTFRSASDQCYKKLPLICVDDKKPTKNISKTLPRVRIFPSSISAHPLHNITSGNSPMAPSSRINALNVVGDLLRKVGVSSSIFSFWLTLFSGSLDLFFLAHLGFAIQYKFLFFFQICVDWDKLFSFFPFW